MIAWIEIQALSLYLELIVRGGRWAVRCPSFLFFLVEGKRGVLVVSEVLGNIILVIGEEVRGLRA